MRIPIKLIGGYSGNHGFVSTEKHIILPFLPFDGLEINMSKMSYYVQIDEDLPIIWNHDKGEMTVYLQDFDDRYFSSLIGLDFRFREN